MILSISKIKCFKSCRRMYELKYLEGLEPVQKADALQTGTSYHKFLEELNSGTPLAGNAEYENEFSKEFAMARAYEKFIYPAFKVIEAEKWLEYDLGNDNKLVGIADGIAEDNYLVEHKSTSGDITEAYEYNLQWDEQILAYMLMTGNRKVHYTVCRKPTIRLCKNETEEAFFNRMLAWYETDTDSKIRLLEIERTDEEVEAFKQALYEMLETMQNATNLYRNTCHCNMWGRRCEYSPICLHYDPNQEYVEFTRNKK